MELIGVVDNNDNFIGTASRDEINEKKLCHRIVHVLIFNTEGKMALQLRSPNLPFCPNHWSTAVGGHVQPNETYKDGAFREFNEELGTICPIQFLAKDYYSLPNSAAKFITTFTAKYDGPFDPDPKSVQKIIFFNLDEIQTMINNKEKFIPELLFILNKYYQISLN
ncbi:MAG: NUDIX domain-containing protein [bacterium]|nr:NUDIX domain-containing protein [bacterium]